LAHASAAHSGPCRFLKNAAVRPVIPDIRCDCGIKDTANSRSTDRAIIGLASAIDRRPEVQKVLDRGRAI